ncbi:hypothetical protein IMSHALPRED_006409 [Imshaugia aleurites]|uniref:SprT-like domain-containing protein n=1 Tax=Imshaugia aleurites TaxID=172621 RepID=A0A8H3FLU6_9LECA|nr:hypothetical protein IMSHALPRED_006409 [Imshaugia aleurites]
MSHPLPSTQSRHLNDSKRQRLRSQTNEPISWSTGAHYDQPHSDLTLYQTFHSVPRAQRRPKAEATQILVDFLTPLHHDELTAAQTSALNRLSAAVRDPDWDSSLVIKAFADIDVAFFDGRLRGNVVAVWASEEDILEKGCGEGKPERGCFMGLCQPIAPEENEGEPRCRVWLNSDAIFDAPDPRLQMWQTMLHELVHAYTVITSDPENFIDYHALNDPYHDAQFNYLLSMVDRRSMYHMEIPARPAGKGHTICLNCNPRPLMPGDKEFGTDEQGRMLRDQRTDPKWGEGSGEGS